jgi:glucokinase
MLLMDLMADIGATNTRCALLDDKGQGLASEEFKNADFSGLDALLSAYLDNRRATDRPRRAALAVAAPILGDEVHMLNIDWRFSQAALKAQLGLSQLIVCNDFAAVAWGLPHFGPDDLRKIGGGRSGARATLAAIGPGSGLGVAALVPAAERWAVVAGEGGHVSMPALTPEESEIIASIGARYDGHCSAERVLSGPGLVNLYVALAERAGRTEAAVTPRDITALARDGEPLARKALSMFFAMLGTVAGDLALTTGARGGVFIAGGIVPKVLDAFAQSDFRERFESKGRYRDYLSGISTHVIVARHPAFPGLRSLLGHR